MAIPGTGPLDQRKFIQITPGCWWWLGGKDAAGYGVAWVKLEKRKGNKRAHRVMYEYYVGPIPEGLILRHKCNNPSCVNPYHLTLGTQKDNVQDAVQLNRHCHKETHGCAKLTQEQVDQIREYGKSPFNSHREIAKHFGISKTNVSKILANQLWRV